MKKTAIVTAYYVNLYGTKFGGRYPPRDMHYQNSFRSLAKMTNADFFIYCAPEHEQDLQYLKEQYPDITINIIPSDLNNFYMNDLFNLYKNFDEAKTSMRCQELQYCKTLWMAQVANDYTYDHIYWFDMGLSYTGLFPNKYMVLDEGKEIEFYNFSLLSNEMLEGLKKHSGDKITFMLIANRDVFVYRRHLDLKYYPEGYKHEWHCIGGILGGKRENVKWLHETFCKEAVDYIQESKTVEDEEVIYQFIYAKYQDRIAPAYFDVWHHEDNNHPWLENDDDVAAAYRTAKPFYTVLEDFIKLVKQ